MCANQKLKEGWRDVLTQWVRTLAAYSWRCEFKCPSLKNLGGCGWVYTQNLSTTGNRDRRDAHALGLLDASLAPGPVGEGTRQSAVEQDTRHPPLAPVYLCSGLCTHRHMHVHHRQTGQQTDIRERFKNQKWLQKVLMKVRCHTDILNMAELNKVNREKYPGCGDKSRVTREDFGRQSQKENSRRL